MIRVGDKVVVRSYKELERLGRVARDFEGIFFDTGQHFFFAYDMKSYCGKGNCNFCINTSWWSRGQVG